MGQNGLGTLPVAVGKETSAVWTRHAMPHALMSRKQLLSSCIYSYRKIIQKKKKRKILSSFEFSTPLNIKQCFRKHLKLCFNFVIPAPIPLKGN